MLGTRNSVSTPPSSGTGGEGTRNVMRKNQTTATSLAERGGCGGCYLPAARLRPPRNITHTTTVIQWTMIALQSERERI